MYNVTLREGDIVIIHTGWGDLFEQYPAKNALYNSGEPGIGKDAATWLIDQKVVAVGADTWAVEVIPGETQGGVPGPPDAAHRQRHPHHRERAHRSDRRRGASTNRATFFFTMTVPKAVGMTGTSSRSTPSADRCMAGVTGKSGVPRGAGPG